MTITKQNWLMRKLWGITVLALCVLLLVAVTHAQDITESRVFELGDGYIAKVVTEPSHMTIMVKFPARMLESDTLIGDATRIAALKVFEAKSFKDGEPKFVIATLDGERQVMFFDLLNGERVFVIPLIDSEQDGELVGAAFVGAHLPKLE